MRNESYGTTKALRARELGVSRQALYYRPKKPEKDWVLKCRVEGVLRDYPSYGSRRVAQHLRMNRKRVKRVMNLFGIKAYRRRGRKWKKPKKLSLYPNLLMTMAPSYPSHIWVSDFTRFPYRKKTVYLATVMDIFTRKIVGLSVLTTHTVPLVLTAFLDALQHHPKPQVFHSDNGSEYNAEAFLAALATLGIAVSRSKPGCPWENGYQESFYSQFKVDLGDPNRFTSLGELVLAIYQTIWTYNHRRIHSALRMAPAQFALQATSLYNEVTYKVRV